MGFETKSPLRADEEVKDKSPMGTIVASVIATLALIALIIVTALYLKRTTTYKAIISGGKRRSELPLSNKDFNTVSFVKITPLNNEPHP